LEGGRIRGLKGLTPQSCLRNRRIPIDAGRAAGLNGVMNFVIIGRDKAEAGLRARHRAAHLDYVDGHQDKIVYAGPLLEAGEMIGSLFVFEVASREVLDAYCAGDPYFQAPIFESIEIFESRWLVPERETGSLRAEAERARGRD
jgi:uncharacterized protein YciI